VKDNKEMGLCCSCIHQIYSDRSLSYAKDVPKNISKLMKAYYFQLKPPKFEVEFPKDEVNPSSKYPDSLQKNVNVEGDTPVASPMMQTFIQASTKSGRPQGHAVSKTIDVMLLIMSLTRL
jgi:hypothetical protein